MVMKFKLRIVGAAFLAASLLVYATQASAGSKAANAKAKLEVRAVDADTVYNVPDNTNNVVLGRFALEAVNQPSTISSLALRFQLALQEGSTASLSAITNVRLFSSNGTLVSGPFDITDPSGVRILTDRFSVPVGENIYLIKADLSNGFAHNDPLVINLNPREKLSWPSPKSAFIIYADERRKSKNYRWNNNWHRLASGHYQCLGRFVHRR